MATPRLVDLMIVAASEAWRDNGEVLASGIGIVPRLAAGLAKVTHAPQLLMTDSECFLVSEPVPIGPRGDYQPKIEGYMPFYRIFECIWGGRRHAMVGPIQIDRWGQTNLSVVGDYARPKAAMLGVRGLPGNSINHVNSLFVPNHSARTFVAGEVDMVSGVGYRGDRWLPGMNRQYANIGLIISNLAVLDCGGPGHAMRVRSLHPGVSIEELQAATGFPLSCIDIPATTPLPTDEQLAIIARLDPHGLRATVLKSNPPVVDAPARLYS
jgi:glutaconate CoA-transferase, subunit B